MRTSATHKRCDYIRKKVIHLDERSKTRMLLSSWGRSFEKIRDERDKLKAIKMQLACTLPPAKIDGMPRAPGTSDIVLSAVEHNEKTNGKYAEEKARADELISEVLREKFALDVIIDALPLEQRKIIRLRYEAQHTFSEIAGEAGKSLQWVYGVEASAVDRIAERTK